MSLLVALGEYERGEKERFWSVPLWNGAVLFDGALWMRA